MVLVDSNVVIDVLEDDPNWFDWSAAQLRAHALMHELAVNPIVYAELALAFTSHEALDAALRDLELRVVEVPRPALFLAGKAFIRYRREGGARPSVLPDFFIGAHAAVTGMTLITRDARRYRNYFPGVKLVSPA